ncbi:MAG TPA: hypothetical protein VGI69_02630 [Gaiellaceae bacterium]|jgi:hypothetical protein
MRAKLMLAAAFLLAAAAVTEVAAAGSGPVQVVLSAPAIDLYHSASVRVSGITAHSAQVRPVGAIDRAGLAYKWKPYRWRALRARDGTWHGQLPAPPLFGIYRLQLRFDRGRKVLSSPSWLLRVFPHGTMARRPSPTGLAAVRGYVAHLPGHQTLVALRRWPLASFDHRDPRLNRLFVIAYAPRGDKRRSSRLGRFVTTVRDGYHGRWRILQATTQPYD